MKAAYDEGVEEGGLKTGLKVLPVLGRKRFGTPEPEIELALRRITDLDRLERMTEAVLEAKDWPDLLETP